MIRTRVREAAMMRIQRQGKMCRVAWYTNPKMGLATNCIVDSRKPMMVKILPTSSGSTSLDTADLVVVKML